MLKSILTVCAFVLLFALAFIILGGGAFVISIIPVGIWYCCDDFIAQVSGVAWLGQVPFWTSVAVWYVFGAIFGVINGSRSKSMRELSDKIGALGNKNTSNESKILQDLQDSIK